MGPMSTVLCLHLRASLPPPLPQQDAGLSLTQLMFIQLMRTKPPAITYKPVNRNQSAVSQKKHTPKMADCEEKL